MILNGEKVEGTVVFPEVYGLNINGKVYLKRLRLVGKFLIYGEAIIEEREKSKIIIPRNSVIFFKVINYIAILSSYFDPDDYEYYVYLSLVPKNFLSKVTTEAKFFNNIYFPVCIKLDEYEISM